MPEVIEMTVSLPPILSAINLDGMGDGGRIKLDVPGTDRAALLELAQWAGRVLRVTVEVAE